MKKTGKILLFGFVTWFVPFIFSFLFFDKSGNLAIDEIFFKSIMIVVGSLTGCIMLYYYFKKLSNNYFMESVLIGISWLLINYLLDIFILLPMSGMSFGIYFQQIGLRYLVLPFLSITIGLLLQQKSK